MFCKIFCVNETTKLNQIGENRNDFKEKFSGTVSDLLKIYWRKSRVDKNRLSSLVFDLTSESRISSIATKVLFKDLVEPLMDSFTIEGRMAYIEIFSRIISSLREFPRASKISEYLNRIGLNTNRKLLNWAKKVTMQNKTLDADQINKVKKVFVLSRVTIGADVAITSIALQRIIRELHNAEIFFVGPRAQTQLFGVNQKIKTLEMSYNRKGNFINRLESWIDLVDLVENNTIGFSEDEYLIVDTDSRLTQLGVMPLPIAQENYIYFNSSVRDIEHQNNRVLSMAEATNLWLNEVFGNSSNFIYPRVWAEDKAFSEKFFAQPAVKDKSTVFVNLGVGDNNDKRLGIDFEKKLIEELINQDMTVVLSKGTGAEAAIIDKIINFISSNGIKVIETTSDNLDELSIKDAKVIAHKGSLGELVTLISKSDYYVGYDSLGQHLAAALNVPLTTIMAGFINEYFRQRWTPSGEGIVNVIPVDTMHIDRNHIDEDRIISYIVNNVLSSFNHQKKKR